MLDIKVILTNLSYCCIVGIAMAMAGIAILTLIIFAVTMRSRLRAVKSRDDRWR